MKLTNQQLTIIEETLVSNGVVYDDIKLELIDHIASEIEVEAISEAKPFEIILIKVFNKWKPQLILTSHSLLLGRAFLGPKIITDKFADDKKKELFVGGVTIFMFTVLILLINNKFQSPSILSSIVFVLQTTSVLGALLMISARLIVSKTKTKTTYLFWFNKSFNLILLYGLIIGFGFFPIYPMNIYLEIKVGSLIVTLMYLFLLHVNLKLIYKHFQFEKKLSYTKP